MTATATRPDELAVERPCDRCRRPALLRIAWICADCVADLGLRHPEQHAEWRDEVRRWTGAGCPPVRPDSWPNPWK